MRMNEYRSAIVYFRNNMIWQGPSDHVQVDYHTDSRYCLDEYGLLSRIPYPMVLDVTVNEGVVNISGEAKEVVFYAHVLPKMISYGE